VRFIWKDFPLPSHPNAKTAAEAGLCANDQGAFWRYHDLLFANQSKLTAEDLKQYAKQIGLDQSNFVQCLDGGKYQSQVANAVPEGGKQGVSATPAIFINGRPVIGSAAFEALDDQVSKELAARAQEWRVGP
jgi:protein-disulfide isomerase